MLCGMGVELFWIIRSLTVVVVRLDISTSGIQDRHPKGLKLLTRLRLGLSHLREQKFRHSFNDTIDPFCLCGTNSFETSEHFFLHCLPMPIYASNSLTIFVITTSYFYHW